MEQETSKDGQIHASIAKRVGLILTQYEELTGHLPANQRYEATLCLSLLQTLLTQCTELIESNELAELKTALDQPLSNAPSLFGLSSDCVKCNTMWSDDKLTHRNVIKSLRNAMSHPNKQMDSAYPVTGFKQCLSHSEPSGDGLGLIEGFEFVHSPWVKWKVATSEWALTTNEREMKTLIRTNGLSQTVTLQKTENGFRAYKDDKDFVPKLILKLKIDQLKNLTSELSRHLSSPLQKSDPHEGN